MKKLLFIYNPKAGKGEIRSQLSHILEELAKQDYEIVIHPTREAQDAVRVVRDQGEGFDLLVCSGGDGTLDEVVTGMQLAGLRTPLGYIPAGSTNDFAASLGIPRQMRRAAKVITEGIPYECDLGKLNDNYFVYVAAFGVFTDVSYKTSQDWKNMLGHLAYILEGVKSLSSVKSWRMRMESAEYSGSGEFFYGMITNSNSVGGFKGITGKNVTLNDGMFEVTLIRKPENFIEWPLIINALVTGEKNPYVISFKASRLEVFGQDEVPWTRDGEYGGSHCHTVIENLPKAFSILIPEHPEALQEDSGKQEMVSGWEEESFRELGQPELAVSREKMVTK